MSSGISRRSLLSGTIASAATGILPNFTQAKHKRSLRLAHLTDTHIRPESVSQKGFENAISAAQGLKDKPDMLLFGGDEVMETLGADEASAKAQWNSYLSVKKANLELPSIHMIGNHDCWGFNKTASKATGEEPLFGKKRAQEALELAKPYYSITKNGWKIIVLDSTFQLENSYTAKLDDAQFGWLQDELANTSKSTHVLIASHIPLVSVCAYVDGDLAKTGNWVIPGSWMHLDFLKIKDLFKKHPNVKAAVSGHMHQVDAANFLGVDYYCNGAVSGAWWDGDYYEFSPGFATIDLYADGTVVNEYRKYDWK